MIVKPSAIEIILVVMMVMLFVVGLVIYPAMPEQMVSHWDSSGRPNGLSSKFMGVFFFPIVMFVLTLVFFAIPRIDPLRENIRQFRISFERFVLIFFLIMTALYLDTLLWNAGIHVGMKSIVIIGFAVILYALGSLCDKAKRNYFIGIRTPWTLNSDSVWDKTHKWASKLFRIAAVVVALGIVFPDYMLWFLIVPAGGVTLFVVVYSYIEYEREQRGTVHP